jgi:nitrogen fixation protein NifU and related proteins
MDIYADTILHHYRSPQNKGPLPGATVEHEEINLSCGDTLTVRLKIDDGMISALAWDGTGCAISQAAMSMLSEELEGKTLKDIEALRKDDIYALLGVPIGPRRYKCALLALHTLKNAIRKAQGLQTQSWLDTVELTDD